MNSSTEMLIDVLNELPELPIELFELGGKFEFSKSAPVLTNHPEVVTADHPPVSTAPNKSSRQIRTWYPWVLYPKVACYPFPEIGSRTLVAYSALEPHLAKPDLDANEADLSAIAGARRYYQARDFHGLGRVFCEVRYGPWFGTVTEQESCDDQVPNVWTLESQSPGIALSWLGTWEDRPTLPNLTVFVDLNNVADVRYECCPGYSFCPTTQSCVSNSVNCPDAHPV